MAMLHEAGSVELPAARLSPSELGQACQSGEFRVVVAQLGDIFDDVLLKDAAVSGISNYAVGVNNIDIASATRHSILVGNTPGVLTDATADLAMLLILGVARRCVEADQFVRAGKFTGWQPELLLGHDITGKTWASRALAGSPGPLPAAPWPSACRWPFVLAHPVIGRCPTRSSASSPGRSPT